jgi:sugar phosphate isomerase/epimerase
VPALALSLLNHSPFVGADVPLQRQVAAAQAAGFSHVGVDVFTLRELGGVAGGAPVLDFAFLPIAADDGTWDAVLAQTAGAAASVGAEFVMIRVLDALDDAAIAHIREAALEFHSRGMGCWVEPSQFSAVSNLGIARQLVERVDVPTFGLMLDSWHFFQGPDTWADLAATPVESITCLQLADGHVVGVGEDAFAQTLHNRELPGAGSFDVRRLVDSLIQAGFDGPVSVEVLSASLRSLSNEAFAQRAYETTSRFLPDSYQG